MGDFINLVPDRLWQVKNLLPYKQAEEILDTDWLSLAWGPAPGLGPRKLVNWDDPTVQRYASYINSCLPEINQALGTEFTMPGGHFWIDLPGFTVPLHTDGHLPTAMQLYWTVPGPTYGTGFYRYKRTDSLLYQFQSVPTSGYIMLNHPAEDGSQPLQWHAMLNPVPRGTIRVSSYWNFK
jgi:hypothetical protein